MTGWNATGSIGNSASFGAERMSKPGMPGLSFFRNRVYDQATGRWTQEDPIGIAGGLNLYQFNGNNPASYTDPFGLKPDTIDVQTHAVAFGLQHASIRITPDNQARWIGDPRFGRDSNGRAFLTIGAGPGMRGGGLSLVSNINRAADAAPHALGAIVAEGAGEDAIIERLLAADAAYADNLPYAAFPAPGNPAYNSNGYVSGLLRAVGLAVPGLGVPVPGYGKPVPVSAFR